MKKPNKRGVTAAKIVAGIAAALTLGANVNGCVYGPQGMNEAVYGPPTADTTAESTGTTENTGRTEKEEPVTTMETANVSGNFNVDVYGPPPDDDIIYDNSNVAVYGPPEDMG